MAKSPAQKAVEQARRKIKCRPDLEVPLREMWDEVLAVANAYFEGLQPKPRPKSFEAQRLLATARERLLVGFVKYGLDPKIKDPALALFGPKDGAGTRLK